MVCLLRNKNEEENLEYARWKCAVVSEDTSRCAVIGILSYSNILSYCNNTAKQVGICYNN